jgi:hypothetical protein
MNTDPQPLHTEVADPEPKHFIGVRRSLIVNKSITGFNVLTKAYFSLKKEVSSYIYSYLFASATKLLKH